MQQNQNEELIERVRERYKYGNYNPLRFTNEDSKQTGKSVSELTSMYKKCVQQDVQKVDGVLIGLGVPISCRHFICQSRFVQRWAYYHKQIASLLSSNFQRWDDLKNLLEEDHMVYRGDDKSIEFCEFAFNTPLWIETQTGIKLPCSNPNVCTCLSVDWHIIQSVHENGLKPNQTYYQRDKQDSL